MPEEPFSENDRDERTAPGGRHDEYEFEPLEAAFTDGGVLHEVLPGPQLAAAVSAVAGDGVSGLSDEELLGMVRAARKIAGWAAHAETLAEAEYAGRHLEWDTRVQAGVLNEFAPQELANETPLTPSAAGDKLRRAHAARERMPRCLALLGTGQIDDYALRIITEATAALEDVSALKADGLIAGQAAGRSWRQLRALCTRVVMSVDPTAIERNRKHAAKSKRVEVRQEYSGNGSVGLREITPEDAMAIKQNAMKWARAMRKAGRSGTLENLRADALIALALERHPLTGTIRPAGTVSGTAAGSTGTASGNEGPWSDLKPMDQDARETAEDPDAQNYDPWEFPIEDEDEDTQPGDGTRGGLGSPAAVINILVPAGLLDGTSSTPAEVAGFGYLGGQPARDLIAAASQNPATRWCGTEVDGKDGTATAHGCARGQHPWTPPDTGPPGGEITSFLAGLKIKFEPVAKDNCDHSHWEPQHDPSRKLAHLIRARNATCATPGCGSEAVACDIDHNVPYECGGDTCEHNLCPFCRRHHRTKQCPRWKIQQVRPGVIRWTGPSGRSHLVHATRYQL
jgi:hypothetical protein